MEGIVGSEEDGDDEYDLQWVCAPCLDKIKSLIPGCGDGETKSGDIEEGKKPDEGEEEEERSR